MKTVFSKTTSKGDKVEMIVRGNRMLTVLLNGKEFHALAWKKEVEIKGHPEIKYGVGKMGLTKEEGTRLEQAIEEFFSNAMAQYMPSYALVDAAHREIGNYHNEFEAMMCDEKNDGVRSPKQPKASIDEIKKMYPAECCYYKANCYAMASNDLKSSAGDKAKEILLTGGSVEAAEEILNNWQETSAIQDRQSS